MLFKLLITFLFLFSFLSSKSYSQEASDPSIFDKDKVLSIISVNYFYNKQPLQKNSKITCELNFYDDYKQKVITKIDKNSNYVILVSNPGKIFLDNIKCSRHSIPLIFGTSRLKIIDDMGFIAHGGFVNYVGELNLNYFPSFFKILDIFNLSNFLNDRNGTLEIKVRDNIFDALNFINSQFSNIYHLKITKSILEDTHNLKPNNTPELYSQKNIDKDLQQKFSTESSNFDKNSQENITKQPEIVIENNPEEKNIETEVESVKQQDLIEKFNDKITNFNNNSKVAQHPYLAPQYSDFYSPVHNPYNAIGNHFGYYIMDNIITQDPVIEHPH